MSLFRCDCRDQIKLEHIQQITSTQAQQITAAGIRTLLDGKKKASKHLYTITFVPFSSVCLLWATVHLATCAGRLVSLYSSYDSHTHRLISTPADTWSRLWGRISGACRVFCSGCLNSSVSFKTQTKILFLLLSVLNESSQEEVSIRDVRILPNLNASYLPMMPDGSVLLVDNVWYVQKRVFMWSWVFTFLCQSVKLIALWSAPCPAPQPPVRWGRHGVFLQSGQPGRPPSQHAQRFGGAWLPVPAAPKRHAARRLQRGSDMFVCFTYDLLYCLYKWFHSLVVNSLFSVFHVVIWNSVETLLKRRLFILSQTKSCNPNCDT